MNEKISFSGGEVRQGSNAVYGTEVWNRDPLPPPAPPKVYKYRLVMVNDKYECFATAARFEDLMDFEKQMRDLDYEFVKLERLEPEGE